MLWDTAQENVAAQDEEVRMMEARIETLKLRVASCTGSEEAMPPTNSAASTINAGIMLTAALEREIKETRTQSGSPVEVEMTDPEEQTAKKAKHNDSTTAAHHVELLAMLQHRMHSQANEHRLRTKRDDSWIS